MSGRAGTPRDVRFERDGAIATITLDRPEDQNRLTPEALAALGAVADELVADSQVQAVILTGAGEACFSMGVLNPAVRASLRKERVIEVVRLANRVFNALEALPQIVIAALNGMTRAGAAELALACDVRLAATHATIAWPEALWGGFPGAGAPIRLPALVGHGRAMELICTGREVSAQEMERIGLVQRVYPGPELLPVARDLARRIAASGPLAVRGAKRIARMGAMAGVTAARELSDALRHELEWSHDVDEGMAAHREGRPPRFTGR